MLTHTKKTALSCLLITVGLLLGYIESLFSIIPFQGVKVGFSNIVVLYAIFALDKKQTYIVAILKVILTGLLFSGLISIIYGVVSIVVSITLMIFFRKHFFPDKISEYGISVLGSAVFNVMQIFVASLLMRTSNVLYYIPYMLFISVFTGILTALITKVTIKRLGEKNEK